jgi:hypothetical protein
MEKKTGSIAGKGIARNGIESALGAEVRLVSRAPAATSSRAGTAGLRPASAVVCRPEAGGPG